MKTTINNKERLFLLTVNSLHFPKIVCNIKDVENAYNTLKKEHPEKRIVTKHFWNGKFEFISKKDLFDMVLINKK
jgi:hypothetical protein